MSEPILNMAVDAEELPALEAAQAEVNAEVEADDDGSITVPLVTDFGDADLRVPPMGKWRSSARNALNRGDDMYWAATTLSTEDANAWMELDPTKDQSEAFFTEFGRRTGQNLEKSMASNRSSRRTRGR